MKRPFLVTIIFSIFVFLFSNFGSVLAANQVPLYFFYSNTCPHCAAEKLFLDSFVEKYPQLEINAFEIGQNLSNSILFGRIGRELNYSTSGVPFTVIGDLPMVGWAPDGSYAEIIEDKILYCSDNYCSDPVGAIIHPDRVTPTTEPTPITKPIENTKPMVGEVTVVDDVDQNQTAIPDHITLPIVGKIELKSVSLPFLSVVLGLLDGFNPCAMWTLLFLISLLLGIPNKKRRWLLGVVFIIASAAVYFLFMVAWLNVFLFIGFVVWVRILISTLALGVGGKNIYDFFNNKDGGCEVVGGNEKRKQVFSKLRQIVSRDSLIWSLIGIILLAGAVNLVELVCSAGLPAIFTQLLTLNDLSTFQYYLYIFVYIFFFMIDDLVIFFIAMITLHAVGIESKYARYSKIIGGILMLIIGLLLLFKPEVLMFV